MLPQTIRTTGTAPRAGITQGGWVRNRSSSAPASLLRWRRIWVLTRALSSSTPRPGRLFVAVLRLRVISWFIAWIVSWRSATEQLPHLALLGEAALLLLREDRLAVDDDVVLALGALLGDGLVLRFGVQLGRETRGPLVIAVSDRAVENADPRHGDKLPEAQMVLNCSNGCRQLAQ